MPSENLNIEKKFQFCDVQFKAYYSKELDERVIEGYASTSTPDRYSEVVEPTAFRKTMKNYMKNPVMFFGHEWWMKPIGKIVEYAIDDTGLFVKAYISKTAEDIWTLIQEKILRSFSIGYNLVKWEDDTETKIRTVKQLELLEISIVNIPANPEALISAASAKGIEIKSFNFNTKEGIMPPEDDKRYQQLFDEITGLRGEMKKLTLDEAIKTLNGIKDEIASKAMTEAEFKEFVDKAKTDLLLSLKEIQKAHPQIEIGPRVTQFEVSGREQARRMGFLKEVHSPVSLIKGLSTMKADVMAKRYGADKTLIDDAHRLNDDLLILGAAAGALKNIGGSPQWVMSPTGFKLYEEYRVVMAELAKAMDTATSGEGYQWVPTLMSATLIDRVQLERGLARRFRRIAMPSNPWTWPLKSTKATAYIKAEALSDFPANTITLSTPGTSSITFTAHGMAAGVAVSDEFVEDSIVAVLPFITDELAGAIADGEENAIINGDNATTHMDTDAAAASASDIRKMFDGLRYHALTDNSAAGKYATSEATVGTAAFEYGDLIRTMEKAGKYAKPEFGAGFFICSISTYFKMLAFTQLATLDVFGPAAINLTGNLPRVLGKEILVSDYMKDDLAATGVNAGADNVHTAILFCNPMGYAIGDRKVYTVESDKNILSGMNYIVGTQRIDFQKMVAATDIPCSIGYDITV